MWHTLIVSALHLAVHAASKKRAQPAVVYASARREVPRGAPGYGPFVVLGLVLGGCCASGGMLAMLGSVLELVGEVPPSPDGDPQGAMIGSALFCLLPSALTIGLSFFSIHRTRRMRAVVALAESRMSLDHADIASALGVDEATARALLEEALAQGYIDRGLVEATEPHGESDAFGPPVAPAYAPVAPVAPVSAPVTAAPDVAPLAPSADAGATRVCPFCKVTNVLDAASSTRPRCKGCGIPFSSRV